MLFVEKSFPRGGTIAKNTAATAGEKEHISFGGFIKKPKKALKKTKKDVSSDATQDTQAKSISAELLSYDTIQDGMNIMGVVKAVDTLFLKIALPGGLVTRVSALHISDAFTKETRKFLEGKQDLDYYKPLNDLYNIGQVVYGRVMEIKEATNSRKIIRFSLKPADVHADLVHSNINKGFIFMGAIEEVQEHGYIIETGINGLRAFVSQENTIKVHTVGELIHLKVDKITHDKAASTSVCKEVKFDALRIKSQIEAHLDYILPTTIVQLTIAKHLKDGLQGTIMNEAFTAYVNEHQLITPLATPNDYELNSTLRARVLYVMPLTKFVYLTLNLQHGQENEAQAYKRGDIVEQAVVHHLGTGGIVMQLDETHKGLISYKTIKVNYKGNYDQDELLKRYAKKTLHKLRILDYDPIDVLYRCTDDVAIVDEKFFCLDDLQPGAHVTAIVEKYNEQVRGYDMRLGKLRARIEHLFLATTTGKSLEAGSKLHCRILGVNQQRHVVYLTNRPEYMAKDSRILTGLKQAKTNSIFLGTVVKNDEELLLVRFFNNIKGLLLKREIQHADTMDSYYVGQTTQFRIISRHDEQIMLGLPNCLFQMGEIRAVKVLNHLEDVGLEIEVQAPKIEQDSNDNEDDDVKKTKIEDEVTIKGLVPLRLLSDFTDLLPAKLRLYAIETQIEAVCINKNIFSLRDVPYFQAHERESVWRTLKQGDIVKAVVKNVEQEVVELMLLLRDYNKLVRVHWQMLLMGAFKNANVVLSPEQAIYCCILGKDTITKTISVSAKLTDVWSGKLNDTANYLKTYLDEVNEIRKILKKKQNPLGYYVIGEKVFATFQGVHEENGDWLYELEETGVAAAIRASMLSNKAKPPEVGRKQECLILWIDYSRSVIYISNRPVDVEHISKKRKIPINLKGKSGIPAKVLLKLDTVFICSLKKEHNPLVYCPIRLHANDFECTSSVEVEEGDFCRLAFVHDTMPIAVLASTYKLWQQVSKKRKAENDLVVLAKKNKKVELNEGKQQEIGQTQNKKRKEINSKEEAQRKKQKNTSEQVNEDVKEVEEEEDNILFFEDKSPNNYESQKLAEYEQTKAKIAAAAAVDNETKNTTASAAKLKINKLLPGISDFWNNDLTQLETIHNKNDASSEEDNDDGDNNDDNKNEKLQRKSRKSSAVDKFKQQQAEEARLRTIEEKYADPKQLPESVDQFDRLVLSDPNNSKNWINYMVFHLQAAEIDKARAVARRALKAISFREINELQNVWVALLNLELLYGTQESYKSTLQEALTYNEPLKVYLSLLDLLSKANRQTELLEIISIMLKKFKFEVEVWRATTEAYFSIGMAERAQQLLQKALASLPEREHINLIVSFAALNHKYDHKELAHTLLDQIVTSYPKRVDVWTQYVDMLIKDELVDSARTVLDRAISQVIPLKKMRTLFKKYLEFEERFGTDADVEKVKRLATAYVKKTSIL